MYLFHICTVVCFIHIDLIISALPDIAYTQCCVLVAAFSTAILKYFFFLFLFCCAWDIFENFFFRVGQAHSLAGFGLWVALSGQPMCVTAALTLLIVIPVVFFCPSFLLLPSMPYAIVSPILSGVVTLSSIQLP